MSYNRNKPKPRLPYRFEGRRLVDLPADIDWIAVAREGKVKPVDVLYYEYWFQRGSKKWLSDTRNPAIEAAAKATHFKRKTL